MSSAALPKLLRIAYQGEPGAYSEKASRELLGENVITIPYLSFEDTFRAVAARDADYAVVPIENSLGGSIHTNYDLLLRYDLHIIAEHDFRVEHSLLVYPGTKKSDVKKVMSHPQALAQCDNYIRDWGVEREATYDTAGSAKLIKEKKLKDCGAIASDLAGRTYGLDVLATNIEDDDNNFTRFLLLSRLPVSSLIPSNMPAKTSIVFLLPNNPGALYKALACFSLRDIDFCKIESRPTPIKLLQSLSLQTKTGNLTPVPPSVSTSSSTTKSSSSVSSTSNTSPMNTFPTVAHRRSDFQDEITTKDLPRFRYSFYLDFLASEFDDRSQNALLHLQEQSNFVRVLGSYPRGGVLIGPIKSTLDALANLPTEKSSQRVLFPPSFASNSNSNNKNNHKSDFKIGIIGFGNFGQFLAKTFIKHHQVYGVSKGDMSAAAKAIGCEYYPLFDLTAFDKVDCDVILISVSIISFEEVLRMLPKDILKGKLIVDVLSVKDHAKKTMLNLLPDDCDILCTHPMFGPESGKAGWQGLPFIYERVRIRDLNRCDRFLKIWETERCKMIEMTCEQHDEFSANSQFITHLTGRVLWQQNLSPTPIDTNGFKTVLKLVENTCSDSFDLFFGLYYYNKHAISQLQNIREALSRVERQLAAKEAYLAARAEATSDQRNRILEECRALMKEALLDLKIQQEPVSISTNTVPVAQQLPPSLTEGDHTTSRS